MKVRTQITLYYGVLLLASILVSGMLFQRVNRALAQRKIEDLARQNLYAIKNSVLLLLENANRYSQRIIASSAVQDYLKTDPNRQGTPTSNRAFQNVVNEVLLAEQTISSIYIFRDDVLYFSWDNFLLGMKGPGIREAPWYQEVIDKKGAQVWVKNSGGVLKTRPGDEEYLSLIRMIDDLYTYKPIGILMINIPMGGVRKSFEGAIDGNQVELMVSRLGETLIPFTDKSLATYAATADFRTKKGGTFTKAVSGREHLFVSSESTGWEFDIAFPASFWSNPYEPINRVLLPIALFGLTMIFFGSIGISRNITRPLVDLLGAMRRAEGGDFSPSILSGRSEEIFQLQDRYNSMIMTIERSIAQDKEAQRDRRRLELDILHEQIKPHFLYNSLESAGYLSLTGEREKSYQLITALASYYRQSLSKGGEVITLAQELEVTRHYLTIETMRYPDAFAVSYQVDGSLDECLIPKLTLQPLVENAVCHGIIPTAQPGAVKITAEQSGERIRLIVEDNGIGMEEAKMRTIGLDSLEENSNSFGLRGTIKRLKLYFGDGFEHTILSWPGEGTVVTLLFPKLRA